MFQWEAEFHWSRGDDDSINTYVPPHNSVENVSMSLIKLTVYTSPGYSWNSKWWLFYVWKSTDEADI
jgi:hypothetical protein